MRANKNEGQQEGLVLLFMPLWLPTCLPAYLPTCLPAYSHGPAAAGHLPLWHNAAWAAGGLSWHIRHTLQQRVVSQLSGPGGGGGEKKKGLCLPSHASCCCTCYSNSNSILPSLPPFRLSRLPTSPPTCLYPSSRPPPPPPPTLHIHNRACTPLHALHPPLPCSPNRAMYPSSNNAAQVQSYTGTLTLPCSLTGLCVCGVSVTHHHSPAWAGTLIHLVTLGYTGPQLVPLHPT